MYQLNAIGQSTLGAVTISTSTNPQQQQQTIIRGQTESLQARNNELSQAIINLRSIIDRLLGSDPEENNKAGPVPAPSGDIQALNMELGSYEVMLKTLDYQIHRLRSV
jgi:hypothetical protein